MLHIRKPMGWALHEREATPEGVYLDRRAFLERAGVTAAIAAAATACSPERGRAMTQTPGPLDNIPDTPTADLYPVAGKDPRFEPGERHGTVSQERTVATYNNFYEFGTDKEAVWRHVGNYEARPWEIEVAGLVERPGRYDLVDLERRFQLQERIYRHRCVEAWSIVVPWVGFPLRELIEYLQPRSNARYIRFVSFNRPDQAHGIKTQSWYPWPYYEGLTMEEAMNELTLVVTGMYGHPLQKQNGAPVRLALPWKYGYKSAKAVERIEFVAEEPPTFWNDLAPDEYSFTSNVNPGIPHPRWTQASEVIVETGERVPTLMFNGYGEWVADLYG